MKKKVSTSHRNFEAYAKTHDVQYVAEDAVFYSMNTGEKTVGREAIAQMLHYIYHVAFDAHAETKNIVVTEDKALLEGDFIGKHIGEFAGIPATNKDVNVPLLLSPHRRYEYQCVTPLLVPFVIVAESRWHN